MNCTKTCPKGLNRAKAIAGSGKRPQFNDNGFGGMRRLDWVGAKMNAFPNIGFCAVDQSRSRRKHGKRFAAAELAGPRSFGMAADRSDAAHMNHTRACPKLLNPANSKIRLNGLIRWNPKTDLSPLNGSDFRPLYPGKTCIPRIGCAFSGRSPSRGTAE